MPDKVWVNSIIAYLELLNTTVARIPANEHLEVADLNRILELDDNFRNMFLTMVEVWGFKTIKVPKQ